MRKHPSALDPRKVLSQAAAELRKEENERPPTPSIEELAPHFPHLRIHHLIGRGGMGAVYCATDVGRDCDVALKVLPKSLAKDPAFEERFVRESRVLASLRHPNVLQVLHFGQEGGWFYLVTELVDGQNLRQTMDEGLSLEGALKIIPQVCDGLHFAHQNGIVHRDIKPENILVSLDGAVKIADFGLAKRVGATDGSETHLTEAHQRVGTPHYMAPEQIEEPSSVDHRADIFSLGVVLYELLTGELPLGRFDTPSRRGAKAAWLDPVVMRSLDRHPDRRYQDVQAIKQDIESGPGDRSTRPLTVDDIRRRRHVREGIQLAKTRHPARYLEFGILAVLVFFLFPGVLFSLIPVPAFAVASMIGFRELERVRKTTQVIPAGVIVAAWLPVFLIGNALALVALQILTEEFQVKTTESFRAWVWGGLFIIDLLCIGVMIRRSRRDPGPRAQKRPA